MALTRRAAVPCLLAAAALLACVAYGDQLPTVAIAGKVDPIAAASPTVTFAGELGKSVMLPHTITSMAVDPNSGVVYIVRAQPFRGPSARAHHRALSAVPIPPPCRGALNTLLTSVGFPRR
jgi:hypothetical protein